ncbi:Glycosyl transferase family 2 [Sphingomonas gellani]|uniref:Glycosyl transferase family 2 n=1 Tax=Sphingomonas gellani TaxID=1166340 RepID=A0A1H8ATN9_9SPHN|nr:glycosyltransferase family A protein [Sphingomonas gellani]SEM73149.1 Glycosyl transferase family 2 [Sphingomonas gellani]
MKEAGPTISVVIPTHGRARLLAETLSTVEMQTQAPNEVLVIDDLGDSETRELVQVRASAFPVPLRYVHNAAEPGACGSRNVGARLSAGEAIAFLDDDDRWLPSYLEALSAQLLSSDTDFVISYIDRCFPNGSVKHLTTAPGLTATNVLHQRVYMTGSSVLIRRNAFEDVGGFDPNVPVFNDWDFFIRLVRAGKRYRVVPEPLVQWVEHHGARITTATLRRADGIDRFLGVYGGDMAADVRAYFLRIAFGIRKAHETSRVRRALLTGRMFRKAGLAGSAFIVRQHLHRG